MENIGNTKHFFRKSKQMTTFKFRNTKTGTVLELNSKFAAELNAAMIKAWASNLHTFNGYKQKDLLSDFGLWETVETCIDDMNYGAHEIPVPHYEDDDSYIRSGVDRKIEKHHPNLLTGHGDRVISVASETTNRVLPENDNVWMTNGQRRRANKAVYALCQVIGVWETVHGGVRYRGDNLTPNCTK
jgi:hypothetical protein